MRSNLTTQKQPATGPQSRWAFDPSHTEVEFAAKHLGMMTVRSTFLEIAADGSIDPEHPEASSVVVTIQTASIRTHNPLRTSNFLEGRGPFAHGASGLL